MSRQGKVRLAKWYSTYTQKERARVVKEITPLVLARPLKLCNFLDWKNVKLIYKRYASLYFVCGVDAGDNELITLEIIHEFVEVCAVHAAHVRAHPCMLGTCNQLNVQRTAHMLAHTSLSLNVNVRISGRQVRHV